MRVSSYGGETADRRIGSGAALFDRYPSAKRRVGRAGAKSALAIGAASLALIGPVATPAAAQTAIVGACTGVSLPRSVVTDIAGSILTPTLGQIESLLDTLLLGTVNLGLSSAISSAAAGQPIRLNVLDVNGNAIDVAANPNCVSQSDIFELETEKGISFGGNQITGLGTRGRNANAGALTAIAIGDLASTGAGLAGAIAIGESASVTGGTASIALGRNSVASGLTLANPAYLVGGTGTSELAIGDRRITGVAAGAADADAVNVAQLRAIATGIAGDALLYDTAGGTYNATRTGVSTRITGVADGTVAPGSSDAVNGSQLAATNTAVTNVDNRVTTVDNRVTNVDNRVTGLQQDALQFDAAAAAYNARRGGVVQKVSGVADGTVATGSTDAVTGSQLAATNADVITVDNRVTNIDNSVTGLQQDALQFDAVAGAYNARRGGVVQKVSGVADGTIAAGSSDAVTGSQLAATNADVTNVDNRVTAVDNRVTAVDNRVTSIDNSVTGLRQDALQFDAVAGAYNAQRGGASQRVTGVADGTLAVGSSDAVNGGQLAATNAQVTTNTTTINRLDLDLAGLDAVAVRYDDPAKASVTFAGAAGTRLSNVANGTADSDAVNLAQLNAVSDSVSTIAGDALLYDAAEGAYSAARGGVATKLTNVAEGTLSADSDDAVNGAQLFATNNRVTDAETNITNVDNRVTNLTSTIDSGNVGPVRYSSAAAPTVASGAGPSQDVTLVGAGAGPVGLHNVAQGTLAAGSTDAVNGGQLFALGSGAAAALGGGASYNVATGTFTAPSYTVGGVTYTNVGDALANVGTGGGGGGGTPNAVAYDSATREQITLGGAAGTRITNVASGTVAAGSTDAVNGGQLYVVTQGLDDVNTRISQIGQGGSGNPAPLVYSDISGVPTPGIVTNTATLVGTGGGTGQAVTLRNVAGGSVAAGSTDAVNGGQLYAAQQGSVQYDRAADGSVSDRISLAGGSGGPVTIGNVAAGISPTDAVNVGQLNSSLNQAMASANGYTDARVGELRSSLTSLRRDAEAATAAAMALGTIPQAYGPGMGMFGIGVSAWGGQSAIAFGGSKATPGGDVVIKAGATYNTRGKGGAAFGAGFAF